MNPLDFTGKRVLVVGGSSGIGNGIAQRFRAAGAEVHLHAVDQVLERAARQRERGRHVDAVRPRPLPAR